MDKESYKSITVPVGCHEYSHGGLAGTVNGERRTEGRMITNMIQVIK